MPETFAEYNEEIEKTQKEIINLLASTFTPQQIANVYVLGDIDKVFSNAYIMAQAEREA